MPSALALYSEQFVSLETIRNSRNDLEWTSLSKRYSTNNLYFIPKSFRSGGGGSYVTFSRVLLTHSRLKYFAGFKNANCTVNEKRKLYLANEFYSGMIRKSMLRLIRISGRTYTHAHSKNIKTSVSLNKKQQNSGIAQIWTKFSPHKYCYLSWSYNSKFNLFWSFIISFFTFSQINVLLPTEHWCIM